MSSQNSADLRSSTDEEIENLHIDDSDRVFTLRDFQAGARSNEANNANAGGENNRNSEKRRYAFTVVLKPINEAANHPSERIQVEGGVIALDGEDESENPNGFVSVTETPIPEDQMINIIMRMCITVTKGQRIPTGIRHHVYFKTKTHNFNVPMHLEERLNPHFTGPFAFISRILNRINTRQARRFLRENGGIAFAILTIEVDTNPPSPPAENQDQN